MTAHLVAVTSVFVRMPRNRLVGVVALVATVGAGAAAFQIDPEVLTDVATPATGLWIPAQPTGEIVRVDAASGGITARVSVGEAGAELVVGERDHDLVVVDRVCCTIR